MDDSGQVDDSIHRQLDAVIAEYLRRVDAGEHVDRDRLMGQFPHLAEQLHSFFESADLAEQMVEQNRVPHRPRPSDSSLSALQTLPPDASVDSEAERGPNQGKASDRDALAVPKQFGRYQILKGLGRGAMGVVYLAVDSQLGRRVALKIPTPFAHNSKEALRRFQREAAAAANLNHPNICSVYDVNEINGTHYIAMEYVEGKPLSSYVSPARPMDERKAAIIIRKLAQALSHAHERGVIHRDLKPANVMMGPRHEPIVTDFGLARQVNAHESVRMTQSGMLLGTPAYMSPEQVEGDARVVGAASDIYSLGVMFYELLTGQLPFGGTVAAVLAQIVSKAPEAPSSLRPELDRRLESICMRMMSKPIGKRFASMNEVAVALTAVLKSPEARVGIDADTSTRRTESQSNMATVLTMSDAQALLRTAHKCFQTYDYEQAVRLLEQIPEHFRDREIESLLKDATERCDEVSFLIAAVEEADRRQDYHGLLPTVERLLALKPGHRLAFAIYKKLTSGNFLQSSSEKSRGKRGRKTSLTMPAYAKAIGLVIVAAILVLTIVAFLRRDARKSNVSIAARETSPAVQKAPSVDNVPQPPTSETDTTRRDETVNHAAANAAAPASAITQPLEEPQEPVVAQRPIDAAPPHPPEQAPSKQAPSNEAPSNEAPSKEAPSKEAHATSHHGRFRVERVLSGHSSAVQGADFSPDGQILASAASEIILWGPDCVELRKIPLPSACSMVAFSPDGKMLAAQCFENKTPVICLFDPTNGSRIGTLTAPDKSDLFKFAFSPDSLFLAASPWHHGLSHIWVWNLATQKPDTAIEFKGGRGLQAVAFSPDGSTLAFGARADTTNLQDMVILMDRASGRKTPIRGIVNSVHDLRFSPNDQTLAMVLSGTLSRARTGIVPASSPNVVLIDPGTKQIAKIFTAIQPFYVRFDSAGTLLMTGGDGPFVQIWKVDSGIEFDRLEHSDQSDGSPAFSPDGKRIAVGCNDKQVYLWQSVEP